STSSTGSAKKMPPPFRKATPSSPPYKPAPDACRSTSPTSAWKKRAPQPAGTTQRKGSPFSPQPHTVTENSTRFIKKQGRASPAFSILFNMRNYALVLVILAVTPLLAQDSQQSITQLLRSRDQALLDAIAPGNVKVWDDALAEGAVYV